MATEATATGATTLTALQLDPAHLVALTIIVSLWLYVLSGGADFGGGVLDLLARGPRKAAQRRTIAEAIAPIWEANHVWLILVVVLLFVAFPNAYAAICTALHIPLVVLLAGIILRGAAFTFAAYDTGPGRSERAAAWGRVFAWASAVTPIMLGVCLGATASGALRVGGDGRVLVGFVEAWWAPFPFAVGLLTLTLCTQLAAVYLAAEASRRDEALAGDFRTAGLGASVAVFGAAWAAMALASDGAPWLAGRLLEGPLALAAHALAAGGGAATVGLLWLRRYGAARLAVIVQASALVLGWAVAQAPILVVPDVTVANAAAPDSVLVPVLWALLAGALLLVPALWWLLRVFKR